MSTNATQIAERDALWRMFARDRSEAVRERLIAEYAYLAKYVVDRLNLHPSGAMCNEDLIGHAIIGLLEAIDRYDESRGIRFETFAIPRIRGAVIDAMRAMDWVPRSLRQDEQLLKSTMVSLEAQLKRPPTDLEVAEKLGISLEDLEKMYSMTAQSALLSLDEALASCGDTQDLILCESEGIEPSTFEDPFTAAAINETKEALAKAISELPDKERLVITCYYFEGLTVKEIAEVLGVTISRVSQLHTKGVLRLAGKLERMDLSAMAA